MNYWQWENDTDGALLKNVYGQDVTLAAIENRKDSIVWRANPQAGDVCLDIGCGFGRVETFLAPLVKEIHGVDFSKPMLARARKRLAGFTNVRFYENDGETLQMFANEAFDLAWSELVFHHVPIEITEKYLQEVARVLKPRGRFICQFPLDGFYRLHSRDVCGWMTCKQARALMKRYFHFVEVLDDGRHIQSTGRNPIKRQNGR